MTKATSSAKKLLTNIAYGAYIALCCMSVEPECTLLHFGGNAHAYECDRKTGRCARRSVEKSLAVRIRRLDRVAGAECLLDAVEYQDTCHDLNFTLMIGATGGT